jgi:hypothetical protein
MPRHALPPSRYGGRRPDGTYAEGPSGFYNPFWAWVGRPSQVVRAEQDRAAARTQATAAEAAERRARRRATPAPALVLTERQKAAAWKAARVKDAPPWRLRERRAA